MTTTTYTSSRTFTVTHAREIASKMATDLKRMQRFYGVPSDISIAEYEAELIELLKEGVVETVAYGFKRGEDWIAPTLRYTEKELTDSTSASHDPGLIRPGANVTGANFYSYLTYKSSWYGKSESERQAIKSRLPITRGGAAQPGVAGYFVDDRVYSAGGRALNRSSVRSY